MKGGENMRRLNKKGAEMTIGTLVVIVLAIIVLVVLALGFGTGWSNLWSKITGYFGGGVNVDSIKQACSYACTTDATYDYCLLPREVKLADKIVLEDKTCYWLAQNREDLGFVDCPSTGVKCVEDVPLDDLAAATTKCDADCTTMPTATAAKDAICNQEVTYKISGGTETKKCSELGLCVAGCKV
ncbi:MAG: hypothetical protein ABH840_01060 [Nanoarchaeota archaeon]